MKKTIYEINERIKSGKAVVFTRGNIGRGRKGVKGFEEVDVVTQLPSVLCLQWNVYHSDIQVLPYE